MTDFIIDLDNPTALDARTILSKTILCWEDSLSKTLSLAGHEAIIRPKSFNTQRDSCGDGIGAYMLTKPTMAWKSFPVAYHIDPTNCNVSDKTAVTRAIQSAFETYNYALGKAAFKMTTDRTAAKIRVYWASHDGPLGQIGICNYQYYPTTGTMFAATVKFDQNDSWFVSQVPQCGYSGSSFDIQNTAAHEIAHALGLSHVFNDPLSTLYPTCKRGETLRRTLDTGTLKALKILYPAAI